MKQGCLFDLDGTLIDSIVDLGMATNAVLQKHRLPVYDIKEYHMMVGNGVKKLMERALGQDHLDILDECLNEFYEYYGEHCLDHTQPYPGIVDMIVNLKKQGVKLAVVTNKPHHLAIKIVEHLFPDTFTCIYGQQECYPVKPHPEVVFLTLMELKLTSKECYFIGDSRVDIETGDNASMETIGVEWGLRGYKELFEAQADYIVKTPQEIIEVLNNENRH